MALPTEIALKMTEASDTLINNCQALAQSNCVVSNQHDVDIVSRICETVVSVGLFICLAVVLCFLFAMLMKAYAKKKDHELEWERIRNKEDMQELERLRSELKAEKKKNSETLNAHTELTNQKEIIDKVEGILKLGQPLSVTLKSGNLSIDVKTPTSKSDGVDQRYQ